MHMYVLDGRRGREAAEGGGRGHDEGGAMTITEAIEQFIQLAHPADAPALKTESARTML
jgi:hypothetical protein